MLSTFRDKLTGRKFTGIILGALAIPFALWGTYSYFDSDGRIVVAKVEGVEITSERLRSSLDIERRQARAENPKAADLRAIDSPEFKREVLDRLIDEYLLTLDAENQGYRIGDDQLRRLIAQEPDFQRNGRFDPARYEQVMRQVGLSPRGFETRVRNQITARYYASGYGESAIVTEADISAVLRLQGQRREVAHAVLPMQRFLPGVRLEAGAVQEYFDQHANQFMTPERVRIEYLRLSAEDLASRVRMDEAEVRASYEEQRAKYVSPEQRRVSHILIAVKPDAGQEKAAQARAEELRAKLKAGADFAALARRHSEDSGSAAAGGDLGLIARGSVAPEFEAALSRLKVGEVSAPVRTADGYHLIRLVSLKPEERKPFQEVRAQLEKELRDRRAEEQFFELAERFNNLVYEQPDSLAPAAEALGLGVRQSEWFTRMGGSGIAMEPKILTAAFDDDAVRQGRNSTAIETGKHTLIAIRALDRQEAARRPLAEVSGEIEVRLRLEAAQAEAVRVGKSLVDALRKGTALEALARQHGARHVPATMVTRKALTIDGGLLEAIFRAPRTGDGKPVVGGSEVADGYGLFVVGRVEDGDVTDPALRAQARQSLSDWRGRSYHALNRLALRQSADVAIYADKLTQEVGEVAPAKKEPARPRGGKR